jgi:2-iminobutanoate/2-iminopropanoate deaminase
VVTVTGGTLVFVAGITSRSEKDARPLYPGDMRAQLRKVYENIGRALRSVGADFSDVVKTRTFTTDVDEFRRVIKGSPGWWNEPGKNCSAGFRD